MPAWILAIVSHWSVKTIAVILVLVLVGGGFYIYGKAEYNKGYRQAIVDHPQNVFNAPATINQQKCPAPQVFGLDLGPWAFGIIHKH